MQRLALLVGVNHYVDERINNLNCCTHDAQEMAFALRHHLGFDDAVVLTDGVSTERVMERLAALGRKLRPGDVFVFFFAGHGKTHDPQGAARDQLFLLPTANVSLLSSRTLTGAPGILSWQALKALTDAWAGVQRLFIFDACRLPLDAARGDELQYEGEAVFRDLALRHTQAEVSGNGAPLAVFNSCPDGAKAEELPQHGHGRFTAALLEDFKAAAQAREQLVADASLAARVYQRMLGLGSPALLGQQGPQQPMWAGDAVLLRTAPEPEPEPERPAPPPAPTVDVVQLLADFERQLAAGQRHSPWHDCCQATLGKLQAAGLAHTLLEALAQRMAPPQAPPPAPAPGPQTDSPAQEAVPQPATPLGLEAAPPLALAPEPAPEPSLPTPSAAAPAPEPSAAPPAAHKPEPEPAPEPPPEPAPQTATVAAKEAEQPPLPPPDDTLTPRRAQPLAGGGSSPEPASSRPAWLLSLGGTAVAAVALGAWWATRSAPQPPTVEPLSLSSAAPAPAQPAPSRFRAMEPLLQVAACTACGELSAIPAGSFSMGSPADEPQREADEGPVRTVKVPAFHIGRTEVTQAQWRAVMGSNPSSNSACGGTCPVEDVSWEDINGPNGFLARLNQQLGLSGTKAYRLPTEAEWEYAARAGSRTPFWWGASIDPSQANYDGRGLKGEFRQTTVAADAFAPNPWGLYNVHGNVNEWVQDCYESDYAQGQPGNGQAHRGGGARCTARAWRGGSWNGSPQGLRSANRNWFAPVIRYYDVGFRIARNF